MAMAQTMDAHALGAEQLCDEQTAIASGWMAAGGLWEMYVGVVEEDTSRYQLGGTLLKEWLDTRALEIEAIK